MALRTERAKISVQQVSELFAKDHTGLQEIHAALQCTTLDPRSHYVTSTSYLHNKVGYMGCNTGTELISLCIMYVFAATTGPWFEIMDLCVFCKTNTGEKLSKLTDVGLETLRRACELRH